LLGSRTRSKISRAARLAVQIAIGIAVVALLAACVSVTQDPQNLTQPGQPGIYPPTPVTEQASAIRGLYGTTLVIATVVFLIVEGLLIIIALRFRRKPTDVDLPKQTHGSNPLEILWTVIPAITVTILFGAAMVALNKQETMSPNPNVIVDVTGFQWQWTFAYPNQGGINFTGTGSTGPEMVLPTGENVRIRLQSKDVVHSFYVPLFNYKLDVIPGRINEFEVKVDEAGTYGGQCAEFCGIGHANMFFTVRAVARADFDAWVIQQQQAASATPAPIPSGGQQITLTAVNITTFDPPALTAKAGQPIVFDFKNSDTTQPHDIAIEKATPDGKDWIGLPVTQPSQTSTYTAPPLPAGTYTFYCAVHPQTMRGTLTVQP
jgi:cytochrome c oxidase subunit 2